MLLLHLLLALSGEEGLDALTELTDDDDTEPTEEEIHSFSEPETPDSNFVWAEEWRAEAMHGSWRKVGGARGKVGAKARKKRAKRQKQARRKNR